MSEPTRPEPTQEPSPIPNADPAQAPTQTSSGLTSPPPSDLPTADVPARARCYQIEAEIARGGMGVVLRAHDPDLNRPLAVKVLLESHTGRPELVQRFIEEAQIAGQMQHPGVAPVYELGRFADDRPYFTMKLVKGKTLATLLAARPNPAEDRVRFVGIFAQVCQTLAYAHARGVLHRDLKPSNVMVGAFNEVQVMDWGLAKVLGAGNGAEAKPAQPPSDLTVIRSQRSSGSSMTDGDTHTQVGSVLGTPAYMSPEQACGAVERIDERSDVFGLGAILCEILTGKPPYVARLSEQVQCMAVMGDLQEAFARLDGCGADAELVALAKTCLAGDPAERPRHAGVVAEAVTAYQHSVEERLHQAELGEAQAKVQAREERKRRRLAIRLGAVVVVLIAALSLVGVYVQQQRGRAATERAQAEADRLRRAEHSQEAVRAALEQVNGLLPRARWAEAEALLDQAERHRDEADDAELDTNLAKARADLGLARSLDKVRLDKATLVDGKLDYRRAGPAYRAAFRAHGPDVLEGDAGAVAARFAGPAVREQAVAALDDWAFLEQGKVRERLLAVARAADPDAWRDRFRNPALWTAKAKVLAVARKADPARLSPALVTVLGSLVDWAGGDGIALLVAAQGQHPADFWLTFNLANLLLSKGRHDEALGYYRAALALRPGNIACYNNLGIALQRKGSLDAAVACYRKAIALDGRYVKLHNNLGVVLAAKKDNDSAIACYRKAIALDPSETLPHCNLGNALRIKGDLEGAAACFGKALDIDAKNSQACTGMGLVQSAQSDLQGAIAWHRKAVALDPKSGVAFSRLGNALVQAKERDEALACHRKAVSLEPQSAFTQSGLGFALSSRGDLDGAIACYRKAVALDPNYAFAQTSLGQALLRKGDRSGAIACHRRAIELDPTLALAHINLARALGLTQDLDGALVHSQKAVALAPKMRAAHVGLGLTLHTRKDFQGAVASYRRAIELEPDYAFAHTALGGALAAQQDFEGAIAEYRTAMKLDPKQANPHRLIAFVLQRKNDSEGAIAALRKAIELEPNNADAHGQLALLLSAKGDLDGAAAAARKAIDLNPRSPLAHNTFGSVLSARGELDGAAACYRRVIALDGKSPHAHDNLGLVQQARGDLDGAVALFRKAASLDAKYSAVHEHLGHALMKQGRFEQALVAFRHYLTMVPADSPQAKGVAVFIRRCEGAQAVQAKLPAVVKREAKPRDAAERLDLAFVAQQPNERQYVIAAKLYADAFAAEPKLANALSPAYRYDAACVAALAAAGLGVGDTKLDDKERARLREQARSWLHADLAAYTKQFTGGKPADKLVVQQKLRHWQRDADLVSVRDRSALDNLPNAERDAWRKLWVEVDELLKQVAAKK